MLQVMIFEKFERSISCSQVLDVNPESFHQTTQISLFLLSSEFYLKISNPVDWNEDWWMDTDQMNRASMQEIQSERYMKLRFPVKKCYNSETGIARMVEGSEEVSRLWLNFWIKEILSHLMEQYY